MSATSRAVRVERALAARQEKLAAKEEADDRPSTKQRLKDMLPIVGGTALGAAAGYGASALLGRTRLGGVLRGLSPRQRLAILMPTMALLGGAIPAVSAARDADAARAARREREKRAP